MLSSQGENELSVSPRRRNVTTSMVGFEMVTNAKISPKIVDPRDLVGERRRRSRRRRRRRKRRRSGRRRRRRRSLLVGCLTSQQQVSASQGRICSDNFTCCHTEIEVADQIFYLTQSQYTGTEPTSPSADPITPGAWQGSHWRANF